MSAQSLPRSYNTHMRSVMAARTRFQERYYTRPTWADFYRKLREVDLRGNSKCTAITLYAPQGTALMIV